MNQLKEATKLTCFKCRCKKPVDLLEQRGNRWFCEDGCYWSQRKVNSGKKIAKARVVSNILNKYEASKICHLAPRTLNSYRYDGRLVENVHFVKINRCNVKYKKDALIQWVEQFNYNTVEQLSYLAIKSILN